MFRLVLGTVLVGVVGGLGAAGQSVKPGAAGKEHTHRAPYTLQVYTRAVLTDVTVTDKHGNPVTGLKEGDFRILDEGKAQRLSSFEEHRGQAAGWKAPVVAPGILSNEFLRHPPPQVNVLLFDTTTIAVEDQMYLFEQMQRFVDRLPSGEPVAVFTRWGDMTLQLSGFTDDHAVLKAAIGRAIPRLQQAGAWAASEIDTLGQMSTYLSQVPGRKNLIWFSSGSNFFMGMGGDLNPITLTPSEAEQLRMIHDLLEQERIAIYPIDARGLTVEVPNPFQQMQMLQDAEATGGQAYMNTNGLALATEKILNTDGNYYTLTYLPQGLKNNGKWHHVAVRLDRKGYVLSYRRGYYDDGSNQRQVLSKTRTMLAAGGKKVEVPNDRSDPIVFTARVEAAPAGEAAAKGDPRPRRGEQRYVVRYVVPARDLFSAKVKPDMGTDVVGSAALAFDHDGNLLAKRMQIVTLGVDEAKLQAMPDATVEFSEKVNLPKGRVYLYLAVWDTVTGRMGTINAHVDVAKAGAGPNGGE